MWHMHLNLFIIPRQIHILNILNSFFFFEARCSRSIFSLYIYIYFKWNPSPWVWLWTQNPILLLSHTSQLVHHISNKKLELGASPLKICSNMRTNFSFIWYYSGHSFLRFELWMRQIMNVKNLDDEKLNNIKSDSSISRFFIFIFFLLWSESRCFIYLIIPK